MTADLMTFLRARLAEDELLAQGPFDKHGGYAEYNEPGEPGHHLRVLAEVDAKRRIISACTSAYNQDSRGMTWMADDVLGTLALPYREHPDYQKEWTP